MVFYFPFYFCRVDEVAPLKCMKIIALCVCVCVCMCVCVCVCVHFSSVTQSCLYIYTHIFHWSIVALQCCQFLLCSKVNQLYVHIYPCFEFSSHLGHHRALSIHSTSSLVISFIHSINSVQSVYMPTQSPNSSHSHFPPWYP